MRDTIDAAAPRPGERWLDLGCGGGQLSEALCAAAGGPLASVLAIDCAAANAEAIARLAAGGRPVRFDRGDLSHGLPNVPDGSLDGVVSGLAVTYAEDWDATAGRWTDRAYTRILAELCRVLRPGGRVALSVNVPEPNFWRVFWKSLGHGLRLRRVLKVGKNALRMQRYGTWLKEQARAGRFFYLPQGEVERRLRSAGFAEVSCRLSYAGQAFVFRATRPA